LPQCGISIRLESASGHLETKQRCLDGVRFASISRNNLARLLGRVRSMSGLHAPQQTALLFDYVVSALLEE
jgi:hypothetical protein